MNSHADLDQTLLGKLKQVIQKAVSQSRPDRLPRLAFVGRRGAGKTTLLNAIFRKRIGEASAVQPGKADSQWRVYQTPDRKQIEILDTRGFQTSEPSRESDTAYLETIIQALQSKKPDVFLFLIRAKEVNSAVNGDLDALVQLLQVIGQIHQSYPAVLVVVTQCDELDPPYINVTQDRDRHPQEWGEKVENIRTAVQVIRGHLEKRTDIYPHVVDIVPIAAFIRIRADGTIDPDPRLNQRWNIDHVSEAIMQELPLAAKVNFARMASLKRFQQSTAESAILVSAGVVAFISATPKSRFRNVLVIPLQLLMTYVVAYVTGYNISREYTLELLTTLGLSLGTSLTLGKINSEINQRYPRHSWLISSGLTAFSTLALGWAVMTYFFRQRE